jgi:hypothetical protein
MKSPLDQPANPSFLWRLAVALGLIACRNVV